MKFLVAITSLWNMSDFVVFGFGHGQTFGSSPFDVISDDSSCFAERDDGLLDSARRVIPMETMAAKNWRRLHRRMQGEHC